MDITLLGGLMPILIPDVGLMFWTVLVFCITWFILAKFAFKPIAKALKNRETSISNALNAAKEAKAEMAELKEENEKILKEAQIERANVIKQAKEAGEKIVAEAKAKAKAEADAILTSAKQDIENQKLAAVTEVKNQAGVLAIDIASELVKKELGSNKEHQDLVSALLSESSLN